MRSANAMSPSMAARPPKRYGTGECHAECAAAPPAATGATTAAFAAATAVALNPAPGLIASACSWMEMDGCFDRSIDLLSGRRADQLVLCAVFLRGFCFAAMV
ncbi:Os08g0446750 [Oryza sativa Japonica Group]|uniref:Os08g0446750 protein n=1 Tax=Oryza sativa subsp. japonica TaxID=39947 RepID=A0A0P0XG87_ORYSJ|nr:hypothetical protein EE612_044605 [Oryza sativa]BAT05672.1 Os08g0446750 [Oryza sativa Japonica Group]